MPTYFFHLATPGELVIDDEGVELSGLDAAREIAIASAREIIADTQSEGYDLSKYAFNVIDDNGAQVLMFEFKTVLNNASTKRPNN